MNVLLTGGAGYIGSHTAAVLAEAGHQVVLFDNFCNSRLDVVARLERITGQPMAWAEGDVRDTALLTQVIRQHAVEAVIHFAGLKAVGESMAIPLDYYADNVQGSLSLLQAMHTCCPRTLVFSSSATVYGNPQYLPIDEQHLLSATTPYGHSKLCVEEMLHDGCVSNPSWRVACLRYFNPVGAHTSGLIGEDPHNIPNNLMPYIARVAAGELPHLNIFGNDYPTADGTGVRDYIHVMDLAEGHLAALDFLSARTGWHAINLGTGRGYSVLEIVKTFASVSGKTIPHQIAARRTGDVAACYADTSFAHQELGWRAHRGLEDMCASTWRWQQNREVNYHKVIQY